MIVEVCANSLESALIAERAGADRIELCSELAVGGITPSYGVLQQVREAVSIPVHVLIRPRSGDFTYSEAEFETMCLDIAHCVTMGFDGIVAGVLQDNFFLDQTRMRQLLSLKGGLHFTFHRAFDWIPNPMEAYGALEALGVGTLLSSGQAGSALEGLPLLRKLRDAEGRCTVMPGAGIGSENARIFLEAGFSALHLSAATLFPHLPSAPPIPMNSPRFLSDTHRLLSQESVLRSVVESVK